MKFCPNCGERLEDAVSFCPNCGRQISTDGREGTQQGPSVVENVIVPTQDTPQQAAEPVTGASAYEDPFIKKPKKKKTGLIIVLVCVTILLIGAVVVFCLYRAGAFLSPAERLKKAVTMGCSDLSEELTDAQERLHSNNELSKKLYDNSEMHLDLDVDGDFSALSSGMFALDYAALLSSLEGDFQSLHDEDGYVWHVSLQLMGMDIYEFGVTAEENGRVGAFSNTKGRYVVLPEDQDDVDSLRMFQIIREQLDRNDEIISCLPAAVEDVAPVLCSLITDASVEYTAKVEGTDALGAAYTANEYIVHPTEAEYNACVEQLAVYMETSEGFRGLFDYVYAYMDAYGVDLSSDGTALDTDAQLAEAVKELRDSKDSIAETLLKADPELTLLLNKQDVVSFIFTATIDEQAVMVRYDKSIDTEYVRFTITAGSFSLSVDADPSDDTNENSCDLHGAVTVSIPDTADFSFSYTASGDRDDADSMHNELTLSMQSLTVADEDASSFPVDAFRDLSVTYKDSLDPMAGMRCEVSICNINIPDSVTLNEIKLIVTDDLTPTSLTWPTIPPVEGTFDDLRDVIGGSLDLSDLF